jgi:hypothetical protein
MVGIVILAVAAAVLLAISIPVAPPPPESRCGGGAGSGPGCPFTVGDPVPGVCPARSTFATVGCLAGDYTYGLTIESSVVTFENVLFEVETPTGSNITITGAGGFAILPSSGGPVAEYSVPSGAAMTMSSRGWTYASDTSNSSLLAPGLFSILIDLGTTNLTGQHDSFVATLTDGYSGSTSPIFLP